MSPADAVLEHYRAQQRQAEATSVLVRRIWRSMTPDLDRSWASIASRVTFTVTAAQLGAARAGAAYVPIALAQQGVEVEPLAQPNPKAWAGIASDGRPLESLLYSAVVRSKLSLGNGSPMGAALADGGTWLDTLARTQVADASRGAAGVAITARPKTGHRRFVSPPCCQRCAVLAGRVYRWSQGFDRHPGCDCRMEPVAEDAPEGHVADIRPDLIKDLTKDQRKAINDGADLNQVINAHRRGARSSDGMTTSEGTTRRGVYGGYRVNPDGSFTKRSKGESPGRRLTPEAIYRVSSTREEALQKLKQYGYVL